MAPVQVEVRGHDAPYQSEKRSDFDVSKHVIQVSFGFASFFSRLGVPTER